MLGYIVRTKDSAEVFIHNLQPKSIKFCWAVLTYSRKWNQQPLCDIALKAVHIACHRNLVLEVKRREGKKWEMDLRGKNEKSFFFFPFLPSLLEYHKDPQKMVLRCHTSPYRGWDCSCPGNIPLAAGWGVLGLLPVRSLCCDCAFVWITDSVLSYVWLLGRALVEILGISLTLSRAVQECWRSWQLHRCAGIPTRVWTASQGSAGHFWKTESLCQYSPLIWTSLHCFHVYLVNQFR